MTRLVSFSKQKTCWLSITDLPVFGCNPISFLLQLLRSTRAKSVPQRRAMSSGSTPIESAKR